MSFGSFLHIVFLKSKDMTNAHEWKKEQLNLRLFSKEKDHQ